MRYAFLLGLLVAASSACAPHDPEARVETGGEVERGRTALRQYGCQTCHVIPGVTGAESLTGPPLNGIGDRRYLAGVLPNSPENMVEWLKRPQEFSPLSAMPDLGVTDEDARHMAAYLFTLR